MSKLFNSKEWLTLSDAAKHLARVSGENVNEADIIRLALDGELRLSVHLVNHGKALRGHIVPISDAHCESVPLPDGSANVPIYKGPILCTGGEDSHVVELEDEILTLKGIFDLPMIGNEQQDIAHDYHALTGGPRVTHGSVGGTFVEGKDGVIYQIQDYFDDNPFLRGSKAHLTHLRASIENGNIATSEVEGLLKRYNENRKKLVEKKNAQPELESYYPAGTLPKDRVLVVRTAALRQFERFVGLATENETPAQRQARLRKRVREEKAKGTKAFLKTVAEEEVISRSRLKQIIGDDCKSDLVSRWAGLAAPKRQSTSKKIKT